MVWDVEMSLKPDVIEEKVLNGIKSIEEELGVADVIALVDGKPSCPQCLRIEVGDVDSFLRILYVLAKQSIATGAVPIIVLKRRTPSSVSFYIVSPTDQLIVSLEHEIKY